MMYLLLNVIKRIRRVDGEADEDDVRVWVRQLCACTSLPISLLRGMTKAFGKRDIYALSTSTLSARVGSKLRLCVSCISTSRELALLLLLLVEALLSVRGRAVPSSIVYWPTRSSRRRDLLS